MSTDFQLAPTTTADPAPHNTPTEQPTVPAPTPHTTEKAATQLNHTPGGLPAIPLAVITSNTTVAGLSAIAVTTGPAAAAAAAGSLLVGAVAVKAAGARATRKTIRKTVTKNQAPSRTNQQAGGGRRTPGPNSGTRAGAGSRTGGGSGGGRTAPRRAGATPSAGAGVRKPAASSNRGTSAGKHTSHPGTTGLLKKKPTSPGGTGGAGAGHGKKTHATGPKSRTGQIKALRREKTATTPTRKERRTKDLADRRSLRDARRHAKQHAKDLKNAPRTGTHTPNRGRKNTSPAQTKPRTVNAPITPTTGKGKGTGKAAHTLRAATAKTPRRPGLRGWVRHQSDQTRNRLRTAYDNATANRAHRIRQAHRKAKARTRLARQRTAARTRFALHAAARALLAAPAGLLGLLTTPLGRRLGWAWLQYPGRRLYHRLTAAARHNLAARIADANNTYAHHTDPDSLDTPAPQPIADTVARAPRNGHTPLGDTDMSEDIKLHFLETSEETVSAARAYEPGGMLHVRQVIKAMPVALENWAMAFAVLAEKSDSEFPLGDSIGEGLDDIHQQMRALISRAEELAETFDREHEADIERLLNPRKSRDAERTWDTTANEDYDE